MALKYSNVKTWAQKKAELSARLDNFATFKWRGSQSFDNYNMFIISDKIGDLKFYNGSNYTNDYSKPQYQSSSGNLTGISFSMQTIAFKVGVYGFTIAEYQEILNWLDPYEVDYLTFDFNPEYSYLVKLKGKTDSPRYVIGYDQEEPVYYTEFTLTWELQGPSCVRGTENMIWSQGTGSIAASQTFSTTTVSYLPMPFVFNASIILDPTRWVNTPTTYETLTLTIEAYQEGHFNLKEEILRIRLQNLTWNPSSNPIDPTQTQYILHITYDSETEMVYYSFGNDTRKLLTLLTTTSKGENMVDILDPKKYQFMGSNIHTFNPTTYSLFIDLKTDNEADAWPLFETRDETVNGTTVKTLTGIQIISYKRTNII